MNEAEAKERLKHADASVLDELYEFGTLLLDAAIVRVDKLDKKAAYAATGAGILMVTVWILLDRTNRGLVELLLVCGGVCAFLAELFAVTSLRLKDYKWFSDNDWFQTESLQNRDLLIRYRLLCLHGVVTSWEHWAGVKARLTRWAQWGVWQAAVFLIASAICQRINH